MKTISKWAATKVAQTFLSAVSQNFILLSVDFPVRVGTRSALPAGKPAAQHTGMSALRRPGGGVGLVRTVCLIAMVLFFSIFTGSAQVARTIGTLPPGGTVTISFDVTINTNFPANTSTVTNQGSVSGTGFGPILTDDPAVGGGSDPPGVART